MNKGKVLVTGGAGFIGSHIVDLFVRSGYKVIVADDLSSGKTENVNKEAVLYKIDIRDKKIKDLILDEKIDYLDHHAAQISVSRSVKDPYFDADVNVLATINILEACKEAKVKKVIFASSGGTVYGDVKKFPTTEKFPFAPTSPYGISKTTIEYYLRFYYNEHKLKYTALRYSNVYGPRQDPHGEAGVVAIFCNLMLTGKTPTINGDGKYIRDYVYCEDVARANLFALESNLVGGFNVGTSKGTDVNVLFNNIAKAMNFKEKAKHGPARPGDLRKSILSYALIQKKLNWKPKMELIDGLSKTVDFFRKKLGL
jgi:UDP-glucose 4-epimerase